MKQKNMIKGQTGRIYRVGIVGAGNISSAHLRALRKLDNVELVGIADPEQSRARQAAAAFDIPRVFRNLKELGAVNPDVVHILTPPASHCGLTLEALDMGVHVFVEKPMALTAEECDLMIERARKVQRVLSVNHSARFDPAVMRALDLIKNGAIGEVLAVDYVRSSEYPPFAGGTMPPHYRDWGYPFRDIGVHALYVTEAFLGEIRDVQATYRASGRSFHLQFDEWHATVDCAKGTGHVYLSWNSRPMENGMLVHGTGGTLVVDSFLETCTIRRLLAGPKVVSLIWNGVFGSIGRAAQVCWNVGRFATGKLGPSPDIEESIHAFYRTLSAGVQPPVTTEEGKRVVRWVDRVAGPADRDKFVLTSAAPALKPASILVTGGTGFLGQATVAALLSSGRSVRILARRQPRAEISGHPAVSVIRGDLGQPEVVERAMEGIEVVYHIGATMGGSAEDYQSGTICGTANVVESALRHGVRRLVYVSSLSVLDYAGMANGARVDERWRLEPHPERRGLYAQTKLEAERIVVEGIRRGLKAVILRPGQIFGPGAEKVPPYGTLAIGNRWVVMGNGKTELPLIYVGDVVDAMLMSAECDGAMGQTLQLVDPETVNQREYLRLCRTGLPGINFSYVPLAVLYCAAAGLEILGKLLKRNVPLTFYRLRSLKSRVQFDCAAAGEILGWSPRTGVREGLRNTFGPCKAASVEPQASLSSVG